MTIRVIETFSGIGAQAKALKRLTSRAHGFDYDIVATCEWEIGAIYAYDLIHNGSQDLSIYETLSKENLLEILQAYNLSFNGKQSMSFESLKRMPEKQLKAILHSIKANNNFVDITRVHARDLPDADLLTYSFPCQDLSISSYWHQNFTGINRDANNRSSLLWQIGRILTEYEMINKEKPRFLLMENVTAINSPMHAENFALWKEQLRDLGYTVNKTFDLNAKNFGIPQNRVRTFMLSVQAGTSRNQINDYLTECGLDTAHDDPTMKNFLCLDYSNPTYLAEALESIPNYTDSRKKIHQDSTILANGSDLTGNIAKTITTKQDRNPNAGLVNHHLTLKNSLKAPYRNLTPREAFLLMGFDEIDFEVLKKENMGLTKNRKFLSHSKLLKLAGNSIVVNILEQIFLQVNIVNQIFFEENNITPMNQRQA